MVSPDGKGESVRILNARMPLEDESSYYELVSNGGVWTSIISHAGLVEAPGSLQPGSLEAATLNRSDNAEIIIDAGGRLLLPGFVDMHMHLDKAFSISQVGNASGTLQEAVKNYGAASQRFSKDEIKRRIIRAALSAVAFGTTRIRSHLDFDLSAGTEVAFRTVLAALEARESLQGIVDIQFFPMLPAGIASPSAEEIVKEVLTLGMDGLGGAPHMSETPEADIAWIFRTAVEHDCPVDLHCDESDDPSVNTLKPILAQTKLHGYEKRVTVDHLCALSPKPQAEAEALIDEMVDARVGAVTLPAANLYLQGRKDRGLVRRGTTRIRELLEAGIPLATASDNIQDPFHPFGQGDLLQIGLLTAYAGHLASREDLRKLLRMITVVPAFNMGMADYGIRVGSPTEFVLVDALSIEEMFTTSAFGRWVYRGGDWVHLSRRSDQWARPKLSCMWADAAASREEQQRISIQE